MSTSYNIDDNRSEEELETDIETLNKEVDALKQENTIYESYLSRCQVSVYLLSYKKNENKSSNIYL